MKGKMLVLGTWQENTVIPWCDSSSLLHATLCAHSNHCSVPPGRGVEMMKKTQPLFFPCSVPTLTLKVLGVKDPPLKTSLVVGY